MSESLAKTPGEWSVRLQEVVKAYNDNYHSTVYDRPSEVVRGDNDLLSFMILQDNAQKLQHNNEVLKSRKQLLERTMTFRRPKGGIQQSKFRRGFKATYGPIEKVQEIRGSVVIPRGDGDQPTDIKRLMPVNPQSSDDVEARFAQGDAWIERKKDKVWPLMMSLYILLDEGDDEEISFHYAARKLKEEFGATEYKQMLDDGGFEHLSDAVRLHDEFTATRQGYWLMITPE